MTVDDTLNGGKTYSGAFKLFSQMQTLKDAEQLVCVLHVKASAIVPHEHLDFFFIAIHTANLDFGLRSHACEFDRVGNKVDNDQPQHGSIALTDGSAPIFQAMSRLFVSCPISATTSLTSCSRSTSVFLVSDRPILENASKSSIRLPIFFAESRIVRMNR